MPTTTNAPRPPKRPLSRAEIRGCTSKERYDSMAEALDRAQSLTVTIADAPLSAYACNYCPGFHLTSDRRTVERVGIVAIEGGAPLGNVTPNVAPGRDVQGAEFRRGRTKHKFALLGKRKKYIEGDNAISKLPEPNLATDDEVAKFFSELDGCSCCSNDGA